MVLGGRRLSGDRPERVALDELHGDEDLLFPLADVVNRDDVRMRDPRHRPYLAHQARLRLLRPFAQRELGPDDLDRDIAIELRVARAVHHAHPTAADRLDDLVAPDALPSSHRLRGRCEDLRGRRLNGRVGVLLESAAHSAIEAQHSAQPPR